MAMGAKWSYQQWRPGGERASFDGITLDSRMHCGGGQDFVRVAEGHYRFRARVHLAPYTWRFLIRVDSPGDGREITLEVADFNHEGRTPWHESGTVFSTDTMTWQPFDLSRLEIVDWTPTGYPEIDGAYGDATHVPYGVRYRLRLDAPRVWLASPTPFTLQHRDALLRDQQSLHPGQVKTFTIGCSAHSARTGYPVKMARVSGPGEWHHRTSVFVVAGEHPAETAGMYACEGGMREVISRHDWLERYAFFFVPILNVDGVFFGRTYLNVSPGITDGPGVNLSDTWDHRPAPEQRDLWRLLWGLRPDLLVCLHNGRHRHEMEQFDDGGARAPLVAEHLRRELGHRLVEAGRMREGRLPLKAVRQRNAGQGYLTETLLLERLADSATPRDSYLEVGRQLARGYVAAMDEI